MKGFDPQFTDPDHYIRVITERTWEDRHIDDMDPEEFVISPSVEPRVFHQSPKNDTILHARARLSLH